MAVAANGSTYNNTLLVLDIDLLASNGSPSYFVFDMATNSPSWYLFNPGLAPAGTIVPRCDSLDVVYETSGNVRLIVGQVDLLQDVDYQGGSGTETQVPGATVTTHAYGNDNAFALKQPGWFRFTTNRDPAMLGTDGWSFQVQGIDDDVYSFFTPLVVNLTPGVNDSSALCGNPDFFQLGLAFRHSPELFMIGSVNFVMGRRLKMQVNFPSGTGVNYQLRSIQIGFGVAAPS
jgi:hypothetical protein